MAAIQFLHVSDAHLKAGDQYNQDTVTNALINSCADLLNRFGTIDYVFFTGDLAFSGAPEQYVSATNFFDALLKSLHLDRSRLFVVPGNHDVARGQGKGLKRTLADEADSEHYFDPAQALPHVAERKAAFISWFREYFPDRVYDAQSSVAFYQQVLDVPPIDVVGIDTSIFSHDEHDHSQLWIGRRAVNTLQMVDRSGAMRIALMHHPFDWLHPIEQSNVRATVESWADICLSGHLHTVEAMAIGRADRGCVMLAAGAVHDSRSQPKTASIIRVEGEEVSVIPIRYEDRPRAIWTLDTSAFPESADYKGRLKIQPRSVAPDALSPPTIIELSDTNGPFRDDSLFVSPNGTPLYVEPRLMSAPQEAAIASTTSASPVHLDDLLKSAQSKLVFARPEFGATILAKRLYNEAINSKLHVSLKNARTLPNYRKKLEHEFDANIKENSGVLILDNFDFERDERLLREIKATEWFHKVILIVVERGVTVGPNNDLRNLPFELEPVYLWPIARSDIRLIAAAIFETNEDHVLSTIVEKVYNDLLGLCIPLTPATVIMYLRILAQDGNFTPLNRVEIFTQFLNGALRKPADVYRDSFTARNKMDILSSLAFMMDTESWSSLTRKKWFEFLDKYKGENLVDFDGNAFLNELVEAKIFLLDGENIYFRYAFYFAYFYGRSVVSKAERLRAYIEQERYLRVGSAVDVVTGLSADNSQLLGALVCRLEELHEAFADKYVELAFDPLQEACWIDDKRDDEKLWQPIARSIERGPKTSDEIDKIKSSMVAEVLTHDQELRYREFRDMESKLLQLATY